MMFPPGRASGKFAASAWISNESAGFDIAFEASADCASRPGPTISGAELKGSGLGN
jgi:hypothetical protein